MAAASTVESHQPTSTKVDSPPNRGGKGKKKAGNWKPPAFNVSLPTSISVVEGESATLPCGVTHLKGRALSWIRQNDLRVISADHMTFISDDRFKVGGDNVTYWPLEISPALRNDSGAYECQINIRPKLSWTVTLEVKVPSAGFEGPAERYIKTGSNLVLTCTATVLPHASAVVMWFHNGTEISIVSPRGGVSIHTQREGTLLSSQLSVVRAVARDAGNYSCSPDTVNPAYTTVFIAEEVPAAMHHESASWSLRQQDCNIFLGLLVLLLLNVYLTTAQSSSTKGDPATTETSLRSWALKGKVRGNPRPNSPSQHSRFAGALGLCESSR
ncbi:zwei Ig domain protein zig-8-like [Oratosquilla oratoria]|uniref:zwei Ig domain protein zig-8-like n=1 Tax=Oratosquilla oratoria TaxID=337810 RepID=UPI003F760169